MSEGAQVELDFVNLLQTGRPNFVQRHLDSGSSAPTDVSKFDTDCSNLGAKRRSQEKRSPSRNA